MKTLIQAALPLALFLSAICTNAGPTPTLAQANAYWELKRDYNGAASTYLSVWASDSPDAEKVPALLQKLLEEKFGKSKAKPSAASEPSATASGHYDAATLAIRSGFQSRNDR